MRKWRTWTAEEDAQLLHMREKLGMEYRDIAKAIGGLERRQCERRHDIIRSRARSLVIPPEPRPAISNKALIDRDRRASARNQRDYSALARGEVTPVFFGDPPPGFSALDKVRARGTRMLINIAPRGC